VLSTDIDLGQHQKAMINAAPEASGNGFETVAREWFLKSRATIIDFSSELTPIVQRNSLLCWSVRPPNSSFWQES